MTMNQSSRVEVMSIVVSSKHVGIPSANVWATPATASEELKWSSEAVASSQHAHSLGHSLLRAALSTLSPVQLALSVLALALCLLLIALRTRTRSASKCSHKELPARKELPGPRGLPIIGSPQFFTSIPQSMLPIYFTFFF